MSRTRMKRSLLLLGCLLLVPGTGCEDENPLDPSEDERPANPNLPNANELIVDQRLIGDSGNESLIWKIIDAGDGGFYFSGELNDRYALGKLDETGQEVWSFRSRYGVKDCIRVTGLEGGLDNCLLTTGGFDSDFDGTLDMGYVSLFSSTGNLLDELSFSSESASVWLHAMGMAETSGELARLVAVGCAEAAGSYYPYFVRFTVASDSTLRKAGEKIFTESPTKNFRNVQFDRSQTPVLCYAQGDERTGEAQYGDQTVYEVSDDLDISWTRDVVPEPGLQSWTMSGCGFLRSTDSLFLIGSTEVDKEVDPASGGYWDAGFVARLATDGSLDWVKSISLSQYSERFQSCAMDDGALYAVGSCSRFRRMPANAWYGNSLLLKVDPDTGDVIADWTFGSEFYYSQFNDVIIRGGRAYAVGYTNYVDADSGYQGWFVVIDLHSI